MKLTKKKLLLVLACISSVVLSIWLAFLIAERFFFDRFFYYKSIKLGYWIPSEKISLFDFGERSKDLLQLEQDFENVSGKEGVLSEQDDAESYTIAVIGDSYAWGQGVRFKDTTSQLLEDGLSQYKKVKVLSLGTSGDSILDYAMKYEKVKQTYPVDLYVFILVDNDSLLAYYNEEKYKQSSIFVECQNRFPDLEPIYNLPYEMSDGQRIKASEAYNEKWLANLIESWTSEFNLCIFDQSLKVLPTSNAIYFVSQHHHEEDRISWNTYKKYVDKNQKKMLYATDGKLLKKYERFWKDPWKYLYVSQKDFHPSKIAHRMFADLLSEEILTNPRWGW